MEKTIAEILNQNSLFHTNRLSIQNWNFLETTMARKDKLIKSVLKIMSPNVTKDLPDGWQKIDTIDKAENWISERKSDSNLYSITLTETKKIIGFLFLYIGNKINESYELRLGYLLTESIWGKGIGSELIKGLVEWCNSIKIIKSISGGVEKDNAGSIRVLEKNGFYKSNEELPEDMLLYKIDFELKTKIE
ncbi:MAG: GNAT family N-acetyltransferase [Ignavibacteria bacterium]|nr:GNAT family N-acetyltransferase [Ignavibacteria bacterium]